MSIGSKLVELRTKKGLTRVQLADELHIPMTTLRNYETDAREPGHKFLLDVSQYFNVTTDYILENEKSPEPEGLEGGKYQKVVIALTNLLESAGWLDASGDISDEDRRFILSVSSMLNTYFEDRR